MSSSADIISSTNWKLMALRLSGRFSMMTAIPESYASWIVLYAMYEAPAEFSREQSRRSKLRLYGWLQCLQTNLPLRNSCNARQSPPSPAAAYPAASALAIPHRAPSASQLLSPSEYCPPTHLVRTDIRPIPRLQSQSGGSRRRTLQESFRPRLRAGCAGAHQSRGNRTSP